MIIIYFYRNHKTQIIEFTYKMLDRTIITFHSMGKIKVAIAFIAVAFLGFVVLIFGVIQDYLVT